MVLVEERRRVALAGHVTPELVLRLIEHDPDVEPLLLRRSPAASTCEGYAEAPDCRSYLFDDAPRGHLAFAVTLAWRSLRLLAGTPAGAAAFVAALRGSTRLAVADAEQPEQRRERWALRLVAWKARALGIPVVRLDDG
jgi:hypothetical protein